MVDLADVLIPDGQDNDPGIEVAVYMALMRDVLVLPSPPSNPSSLKALATVTDDITFKTGKKFSQIGTTLDKGGFKGKGIGAYKTMSAENELTVYCPLSSEDYLGLIRLIQNSDLCFVIPERTGKKRLMGTKTQPAYLVDWEEATGDKPGDERGWKVVFKSTGKLAYYYEGDIQLTPAA